jgi:urease accessory protein
LNCTDKQHVAPAQITVGYVGGKSRLTTAYANTPLKLLAPKTHTTTCHVVLSNYGGGFVSGDVVHISMQCEANTKVCLGTQANTRVYRATNEDWSSQVVAGTVDRDALAVVCQDPLVLHAGAKFRQEQNWSLHEDSSVLLTDWLASGRHETGERFEFSAFESTIRIEVDGSPVMLDRFSLNADQSPSLGGSPMGPFDQMLAIYAYGPMLQAVVPQLSALAEGKQRVNADQPLLVWHESNGGGILRCLAHTRAELMPIWREICRLVSTPDLLGFDPAERKY